VDKARARADGGVGLGLAIAKIIAESHKGKIEVENELKNGTTFIVSIPVKVLTQQRLRKPGDWCLVVHKIGEH